LSLDILVSHRAELEAHCRRIVGSADAEDAVQEALLRAWSALPSLKRPGSARSWLYRIATNASLDAVARRPPRVLPIDGADPCGPLELPDPAPDPSQRYEQREALERALRRATRLPQGQRRVLIMREALGYSARETADALDTSVAAVNSSLQRARRTLEELAAA
jgi:RNA polymerase sigma-70 factor, ECF subfamily